MKATRLCTFPECDRPLNAAGLCSGHRMQRSKGQDLRPLKARRTACAIDECDRQHSARGYCAMHYRRLLNNGHPESLLRIADARERFETFIEKTETCWLWTGSLTWDGYGIFRENNRRTGAHRFAYEYFIGPIPDRLQIDHLCRVKNCVNPDHLEPVTNAENTARAFAAARMTDDEYDHYLAERRVA